MSDFCENVWGFNMGEHGQKYWEAINAYNTAYEGITVEDFVEMNEWWDELAIRFMHKEPLKVVPDTYTFERQRENADDFQEKATEIKNDIRKHWRGQSKAK